MEKSNKEKMDEILLLEDSVPMFEALGQNIPVDDFADPDDNKELTLDDILGVNPGPGEQTFGDQFASIGDDSKTDEGRAAITAAFVSEIDKMPGDTLEVSDIPGIAAVIQMQNGFKGDIEGFLMDTIRNQTSALAASNVSELNPDGAAPVDPVGVATEPAAEVGPAAPEGLPEVPPVAPAPEPALDANAEVDKVAEPIGDSPITTDDVANLLPEDEQAAPAAEAPAEEVDLGEISIDDNDLDAAAKELDKDTPAESSDAEFDFGDLDKLSDDMFKDGGETPAEGEPAPEVGSDEKKDDDKPAEEKKDGEEPKVESVVTECGDKGAAPIVEDAGAAPAEEVTADPSTETSVSDDAGSTEPVSTDSTEPVTECGDTPATAMVEGDETLDADKAKKLDEIEKDFNKKELDDKEQEEFARSVIQEYADKQKAADAEKSAKVESETKAASDSIVESVAPSKEESVQDKLDAIVESVSAKQDAEKKRQARLEATDKKLDAIFESVSAQMNKQVAGHDARHAASKTAQVESATDRHNASLQNASKTLNGILESIVAASKKPAMVEAANRVTSARKVQSAKDKKAVLEAIAARSKKPATTIADIRSKIAKM